MKLTPQQQLYISLNQKIINKRYKDYKEGSKELFKLLDNNTLSAKDYWTLIIKLDDVYLK